MTLFTYIIKEAVARLPLWHLRVVVLCLLEVVWPNFSASTLAQSLDGPTDSTVIGIALPLTGRQKALGLEMRMAAEHVVAMINENGGVNEKRIDVRFFDDACSVVGGAASVRAARDAKPSMAAMFGHPCPSVANSIAPLYATERVFAFFTGTLATRGSIVVDVQPLQFRLTSDASLASIIADSLNSTPKDARVAIVRDRTAYATSLMQQVVGLLVKNGRAPVLIETFAGGDKDFRALSERARLAGITHLAFAGFPAEALLLFDDLGRVVPGLQIVAPDTLAVPEFTLAAGVSLTRVSVVLPLAAAAFPRVAEDKYKRLSVAGQLPSRNALTIVAAIEAWAGAAAHAKSFDAQAVSATLVQTAQPTVMGDLVFDVRGTALLPSVAVHRWLDGAWRPVGRSP